MGAHVGGEGQRVRGGGHRDISNFGTDPSAGDRSQGLDRHRAKIGNATMRMVGHGRNRGHHTAEPGSRPTHETNARMNFTTIPRYPTIAMPGTTSARESTGRTSQSTPEASMVEGNSANKSGMSASWAAELKVSRRRIAKYHNSSLGSHLRRQAIRYQF